MILMLRIETELERRELDISTSFILESINCAINFKKLQIFLLLDLKLTVAVQIQNIFFV